MACTGASRISIVVLLSHRSADSATHLLPRRRLVVCQLQRLLQLRLPCLEFPLPDLALESGALPARVRTLLLQLELVQHLGRGDMWSRSVQLRRPSHCCRCNLVHGRRERVLWPEGLFGEFPQDLLPPNRVLWWCPRVGFGELGGRERVRVGRRGEGAQREVEGRGRDGGGRSALNTGRPLARERDMLYEWWEE